MLIQFDAALASSQRVQALDPLAQLAETFLDVHAVVIVRDDPALTVIGSSEGARALDTATLSRASNVPTVDLSDTFAGAVPVHGRHFDGPTPLNSVIGLRIDTAGARHTCLVFPRSGGVGAQKLRQFDKAARRHISEQRLMERYRRDLRRYVKLFDQMQRSASIGMWECGEEEDTQTYWSEGVFRIFGLPSQAHAPADALNAFPEPGRGILRSTLQATRESGDPTDLTLPLSTPSGERRTVRVMANRREDDPNGLTGTVQDVTALAEAAERLWWSANHDPLTGLPNRSLFADRIKKALQRRERLGTYLAVLMVDVDTFKEVNDTYGHAKGDELLKLVGNALRAAVRVKDTVARTGGDEFTILMEDFEELAVLRAVVRRLENALAVRLPCGASVSVVSLSAGAAIAPLHGVTQSALLAAADRALYRMKAVAGPALVIADEPGERERTARTRLLSRAAQALDEGRFLPFYQPQVDLTTGRIVAVEALARWHVDDGETLNASDFADAIHNPELGPQISLHIVERAAQEIAALNRGREAKVALSINVTSADLVGAGYLDAVASCRYGVGAADLPITAEIPAMVLLEEAAQASVIEPLRAAQASGINLSLAGPIPEAQTLLRLRHLPIAEIKVERGAAGGSSTPEGLGRLIALCKQLKIRLVLQGIEHSSDLDRVADLGVTIAQGYFFSRPVPREELVRLLERTGTVSIPEDGSGRLAFFAA